MKENWRQKVEARCLIEKEYEWMKWAREIPYINLPDTYCIQVIPPFAGAVARICVADKNDLKNYVSVYLDCYNELGIVGEPYWEIYPYVDGDTYRCMMDETSELVEKICESVKALNKL